MKNQNKAALGDDTYFVDVEDPNTGETFQTLSISRTPAMLMSFAANKFTEGASNYFSDNFGLGTVDWRMLLLLARKPGVTSAEAANTIGVDKGTVSRSVSRLTKSELIQLGELHANGRSRGLTLSPSGRALHDKILQAASRQNSFLMKGFDPAEISVFCDLLQRFTQNLNELIDQGNNVS